MKKYILKKIGGYITEDNGRFTLHYNSGATQSCTAKEIEFYGGVLESKIVKQSKIESKPIVKEKFDLNGDGVVDKKDVSLAARVMGSVRRKKKSKK